MPRLELNLSEVRGDCRLVGVQFEHPELPIKRHVANLGYWGSYVWRQGAIAVTTAFVQSVISSRGRNGLTSDLEGNRPSVAATLSDCLTRRSGDKVSYWVKDFLGTGKSRQEPLLWNCFSFENKDFRVKTNPVRAKLNEQFLSPNDVSIWLDDEHLTSTEDLTRVSENLREQWARASHAAHSNSKKGILLKGFQESLFEVFSDTRVMTFPPPHLEMSTLAGGEQIPTGEMQRSIYLMKHAAQGAEFYRVTCAVRNGGLLKIECRDFPISINRHITLDSTQSHELQVHTVDIDIRDIAIEHHFHIDLSIQFYGSFVDDDKWLGICGPSNVHKAVVVKFNKDVNLDNLRIIDIHSKSRQRQTKAIEESSETEKTRDYRAMIQPGGAPNKRLLWG